MAIPSTPATPEQMQIEAIQELDRMRMMSIQSLAMQRIRDSVVTLSRETGFRERPVEQFSQAPLYIPSYQQWSNTQQKLVGTPPPTKPTVNRPKFAAWLAAESWIANFGETAYGLRGPYSYNTGQYSASEIRARESAWRSYESEYAAWQQAQRSLPT